MNVKGKKMEKQKSFLSPVNILVIILLLVSIASVIFFAVKINSTIDSTVMPIKLANQAISTQISQLLHPTPTIMPDPVTIVREVQSLARLETIQYTVEKVITAEINQGVFGPLFGDKLLFVAHGYVIAGVDLSKLSTDELDITDNKLTIKLPDAEVFVATLNNDESYIYDRTTGLFRKSDPDLETDARQAAEQEILNAALEDGILEQAQLNAEVFIERLLNDLGYYSVVFN
jgi:hypothetical protein